MSRSKVEKLGDSIAIFDLPNKETKDTNATLAAIQTLEKRSFPSSESLVMKLEASKRNSRVIYAQTSSSVIVGYLLYISTSNNLRIHKVCVAETFRRRKIATRMITRVCKVAEKVGKEIDLWVDEARIPGRECYVACGFREDGPVVVDYYGPGRNGIRMVWSSGVSDEVMQAL